MPIKNWYWRALSRYTDINYELSFAVRHGEEITMNATKEGTEPYGWEIKGPHSRRRHNEFVCVITMYPGAELTIWGLDKDEYPDGTVITKWCDPEKEAALRAERQKLNKIIDLLAKRRERKMKNGIW
jgi:hypothetical protein